jgi:cytochrome b
MTASLSSPTQRARLDGTGAPKLRVWDLPTRIFHWALTLAVLAQVGTGLGGAMEWHFRIGYALLALLLFRLAWGFVGGRWSRFAAFLYAPRTLVDYLRGRGHPDHLIGHSPLGAISVFALLGLLAAQVATGLVADDEIAAAGPLARFAPGGLVAAATYWHTVPGKWSVIALAGLHVLAVLFYVLVKRRRLVRPMISGDKPLAESAALPSRDDAASRLLAMAVFAACAAFASWIASLRV